jgi:hypothetical protein
MGFGLLFLLLCYVIIVCNGNLSLMMETSTSLTWFEEWFFFFEMLWGRTLIRWLDAERVYGINFVLVERYL